MDPFETFSVRYWRWDDDAQAYILRGVDYGIDRELAETAYDQAKPSVNDTMIYLCKCRASRNPGCIVETEILRFKTCR